MLEKADLVHQWCDHKEEKVQIFAKQFEKDLRSDADRYRKQADEEILLRKHQYDELDNISPNS